MRKISNVKAIESVVTAVLKKLYQLSRKVVLTIIRQLLLGAEADEVSWVMSDCWRRYSTFILWVWLKMVISLLKVSCHFGYRSWPLGF